ncbi:hypothetical protein LAZ67_2003251 [Cordylochernes scorpioides]|uniref:DDE-1 domain-containing protein n=1 Tax=Cordylochernes scorpioides TaxID=51811 RepID=A0ABY6K2M7_9ARAC|nr:hypothetical protein LAZ67_2003251 [Cordylochernes scorpioides]
MAAENRHVLLTMDNCSAHDTKDLDLPNVRIVYFPANCTSQIQPLDHGIIAAFKCHFKSRLVKNALLGIESEQTTVKWNILQAMRAMAASWDSVSSQTIKNCFKKAWPTVEGKTADSFSLPETMLDEPEEWTKLLSATNPAETLTFLEYVALDEGLEICGSPELEEKKKEEEETEDDEEESISITWWKLSVWLPRETLEIFLEDSLRDKMICGLYNAKIQNRILLEGDISLAKVIEIALSMEAAEKNRKLFHLEQGEDCVDKLRMERKVESNFQNGKCKHCGKLHEEPCRFKEAICFKCNKKDTLPQYVGAVDTSDRRPRRGGRVCPENYKRDDT